MKQHITQKQWDELDDEQKLRLCYGVDSIEEQSSPIFKLPNIGQMIEFLGNNLIEIRKKPDYKWVLLIKENEEDVWKSVAKKELCDSLWEGVKYKIIK